MSDAPTTPEVIANMRLRLQTCRRLSVATSDLRAGDILRQMATEIEADIERLEEKKAARLSSGGKAESDEHQ